MPYKTTIDQTGWVENEAYVKIQGYPLNMDGVYCVAKFLWEKWHLCEVNLDKRHMCIHKIFSKHRADVFFFKYA